MARPQVGVGHNTLTFGTSSLLSDWITKGELRAEYCPTGDMVADFFTKPLQGSLFWKLRKVILKQSAKMYLWYKNQVKLL
jgi:hypothetical protein